MPTESEPTAPPDVNNDDEQPDHRAEDMTILQGVTGSARVELRVIAWHAANCLYLETRG